jgi:multidrug efflux pump subunit AcrA (membrane-fusion protein)
LKPAARLRGRTKPLAWTVTKSPGRIDEMLAVVGDVVSADEVVARMNAEDLQAPLQQAEAREADFPNGDGRQTKNELVLAHG